MKKLFLFSSAAIVILSTTACDSPKVDHLEQTVFETNIDYLTERGIELSDFAQNSKMNEESFLTLLTETYEALGGEIDISKINPANEFSEAVKKMTMIGAYDTYYMEFDKQDPELDYGTVGYWLMKLQDSIQQRNYYRTDSTATISDLLNRMNVSTALHTWSSDATEVKEYVVSDLLEDDADLGQTLTRLTAAEMMVSAYEDLCEELQTTQIPKPNDTSNLYAWKANEFFYWSESGNFEPETTGNWYDWAFMSAIIYDSQIRQGLNLEESKPSYGAVVAALTAMVKGYEGLEQHPIEEKTVLNERPYFWHVNQQETGKSSDVNCMPACVEMALRYQGVSDIPSAEQLRNENQLNGLGWNDVLAEQVMQHYGLKFTDSFHINVEEMVDLLDKGNILYVMYNEIDSTQGHSVIIKGYSKLGDDVEFIVSDPNYNAVGPYGYLEYTKDAHTMIEAIERHVPRYFIIPKGE